jgi:RNA polymerase sigma-70 factor (ECF subfamily)
MAVVTAGRSGAYVPEVTPAGPSNRSPSEHRDDAAAERARIERLRAGDQDELEALFHAHYPALCAFARRFTVSPSSAEDVVQSCFVDLWSQRTRLRVHTSLRAYLYAAVRNRALDLAKHDRVEARWAERSRGMLDVEADERVGAQQRLEREESSDALRRAIARLPERARLVVTLRWLHGLRPPEIAEALGISLKGVENQITRALRALRAQLSDTV